MTWMFFFTTDNLTWRYDIINFFRYDDITWRCDMNVFLHLTIWHDVLTWLLLSHLKIWHGVTTWKFLSRLKIWHSDMTWFFFTPDYITWQYDMNSLRTSRCARHYFNRSRESVLYVGKLKHLLTVTFFHHNWASIQLINPLKATKTIRYY